MRRDHILTLSCPDTTGIVYRVTGLLFDAGCNILDAQQFGDEESGRFFLRVHFDLPEDVSVESLHARFQPLADAFAMDWQLHDARRKARLMVLVSKQGHCLNDLLFRTHSRQLRGRYRLRWSSNHKPTFPHRWRQSYGVAVPPPAGGLPAIARRRSRRIIDLAKRKQDRPGGAGALHADPLAARCAMRIGWPRDQHPSQLPAQLQGRASLTTRRTRVGSS